MGDIDWHEGRDPAGITTQDPELMARLDPVEAGRRLRNYLNVMTLECQTLARACGKSHVHNLEPEDLCALTMEAAAMAQVAKAREFSSERTLPKSPAFDSVAAARASSGGSTSCRPNSRPPSC